MERRTLLSVVACALFGLGVSGASASLTLLGGPPVATHAGNLVTNGSFETGAAGQGSANWRYWATGTANSPFLAIPAWGSSGPSANYAVWGSDDVGGGLASSAALPDGQLGVYFGNGTGVSSDQAPTFNANGTVSFAATPTFTPKPSNATPVVLSQSIPTDVNPASSYILSFWASGEFSGASSIDDGIFGLRVTNVLAGDPINYLNAPGNAGVFGPSHRYEFSFTPINPLLPVTVEFINWGHMNLVAYGGSALTTELVLDDVMVNAVNGVPTPGAFAGAMVVGACIVAARLRRRGR